MVRNGESKTPAMTEMIRSLLSGPIATKATGTLVLKLGNSVLLFFTSIVLARAAGAEGFGAFSYALSWVNVLCIVATFGLDRILARDVAVAAEAGGDSRIRSLLAVSRIVVLGISMILVTLVYVLIHTVPAGIDPSLKSAVFVALPLVPMLGLILIHEGFLRGLHRIVSGQFPQLIVRPGIFLVFLLIWTVCVESEIDGKLAVLINISATAVAAGVSLVMTVRWLPPEKGHDQPRIRVGNLISSSSSFLLIAVMQVASANVGILMAGSLLGSAETGIFTVALRLSQFISLALFAVNMPLGPQIAAKYTTGDIKGLQRIVTKGAWAVMGGAFAVTVLFLAGSSRILSFFGEGFIQGRVVLIILTIGQFINAAAGSVGLILTMTGHEKLVVKGHILSTAILVISTPALIQVWGIPGAAVASTVSFAAWNGFMTSHVYRRVGVHASLFSSYWSKFHSQ